MELLGGRMLPDSAKAEEEKIKIEPAIKVAQPTSLIFQPAMLDRQWA